MKRFAILACIVAIAALATGLQADRSSYAVAKVKLNVDPNVKVELFEEPVIRNWQTGEVDLDVIFRIDANQQIVYFYVEASDLYKGDDPLNTDVPPVPLCLEKPVLLTPAQGNQMDYTTNEIPWDLAANGEVLDDFSLAKTECRAFESSQNNHFSQEVVVKVWWNQDDPEKPQGQYGGRVRLTCLVEPCANDVDPNVG